MKSEIGRFLGNHSLTVVAPIGAASVSERLPINTILLPSTHIGLCVPTRRRKPLCEPRLYMP